MDLYCRISIRNNKGEHKHESCVRKKLPVRGFFFIMAVTVFFMGNHLGTKWFGSLKTMVLCFIDSIIAQYSFIREMFFWKRDIPKNT